MYWPAWQVTGRSYKCQIYNHYMQLLFVGYQRAQQRRRDCTAKTWCPKKHTLIAWRAKIWTKITYRDTIIRRNFALGHMASFPRDKEIQMLPLTTPWNTSSPHAPRHADIFTKGRHTSVPIRMSFQPSRTLTEDSLSALSYNTLGHSWPSSQLISWSNTLKTSIEQLLL